MGRVLLYLYPGCIYREVADVVHALSERHTLDVAAAEVLVVRTDDGVGIEATIARRDVRPSEYRAVIVPGGDVEEPLGDRNGLLLLAELGNRDAAVVGGICNGVVVVGAAGLLDGRRATHTVRPPLATAEHLSVLGPHVERARFVDEDVVVDGGLVTAKPWANAAFARAVIAALTR